MYVLDQECVDLGGGRIETRYTLATVLPMKGPMSSVQEVRIPGGAVGARGLFVPGMPRFETGQGYQSQASQQHVVDRGA